MLLDGMVLGTLTSFGMWLIYKKLPPHVRAWLERHNLVTDFAMFLGVYWLYGGTLTALFAAAISGIEVSAYLEVKNHPDDYLWLYAGADRVNKELSGMRRWLKNVNESYKAKMMEGRTNES